MTTTVDDVPPVLPPTDPEYVKLASRVREARERCKVLRAEIVAAENRATNGQRFLLDELRSRDPGALFARDRLAAAEVVALAALAAAEAELIAAPAGPLRRYHEVLVARMHDLVAELAGSADALEAVLATAIKARLRCSREVIGFDGMALRSLREDEWPKSLEALACLCRELINRGVIAREEP